MQCSMRIMSIFFLLIVMLSTAFAACDISVDNLKVELRAEDDYDNEIIAGNDEDIDIRVTFDVDDYSGSTCSSTDLTIRTEISRYNNSTSSWSLVETKIKTEDLDEGDYTISYANEFDTGKDSNYTKFKVESFILNGPDVLDSEQALVEVEHNSCDLIEIDAGNVSVNDNDSETETFTIQNNSGVDFRISSIDLSSSSSLLDFDEVDYLDYVDSDSKEEFEFTVDADEVSRDTTVTAYLNVSGYLGNNYCSASEIGKESISVRIENNSDDDDDDDEDEDDSSSDCDDIDIQTRFTEYAEGTTQKIIFGIKNNSTKRFEILSVEPYSSSFTLSKYFNEKYIFSGQTGDLILNAVFPNVMQDRTLQGTVKVRGVFSDGKSCSFTQIGTKTFDVNVIDLANNSTNPNCSKFNISVPDKVTVENYGSFEFTITNATNRTAKIIVEGSIDVSPSIIVLPKDSSLTKTMNVKLNSSEGFVKLIPSIEGCSVQEKVVQIKNTAQGKLTDAEMNLSINRDYNLNVITLLAEIYNPTNKIFNGKLEIESPEGWPDISKEVVLVPGKNNFVERLGASGPTQEGEIKVNFSSEGKTISESIKTSEQSNLSLAGLFAFGVNYSALGIILLIILVVVLIVGLIENSPTSNKQKGQDWVESKN